MTNGWNQTEVATCPMTAEYCAAGAACKEVVFYRQLFMDLGWTQYVGNKTILSLVIAPVVSVHHHNIRQLSSRGLLRLQYVPFRQMRTNVLTKVLPRIKFLLEWKLLFNCDVNKVLFPLW